MPAPLYPIVDRATLDAHGLSVAAFAAELAAAGVMLLQYRDKVSGPQEILRACDEIEAAFEGIAVKLILNDRADLAALRGWGVHVGQGDLPVAEVAQIVATAGVSTHTEEQVRTAEASVATYIAIGPVFGTATKLDAAPAVGLEGVRRARALTTKPLVAIGGITLANCRSVLDAGADSVAVIGGLFVPGRSVREVVEDFLERLR